MLIYKGKKKGEGCNEMDIRKLVSIQLIDSIEPIEGADRIVKARVLGWDVVVRKDEFKVGDLCVYFEIDSLLPDTPPFHFLFEKDSVKKEMWRLRTAKLRGVISQGLALPIGAFPELKDVYGILPDPIGIDLTESFGIIKYEQPEIGRTGGDVKGSFPGWIPKTDEIRLQACYHKVGIEMWGRPVYVTTKFDGTSFTSFHNDDELVVCSRNNIMKDGDNCYWKIAHKYDLVNRLKGSNLVVQGEVCGPGIAKNRLGFNELKLLTFNTFSMVTKQHDSYDKFKYATSNILNGIPSVFDYEWYETEFDKPLESWLGLAKGKYPGTTNNREGIVIRTTETNGYSNSLQGRFSVKVINNDYLLKDEE
jgi:RNA ligase (TIGR02306 family)